MSQLSKVDITTDDIFQKYIINQIEVGFCKIEKSCSLLKNSKEITKSKWQNYLKSWKMKT